MVILFDATTYYNSIPHFYEFVKYFFVFFIELMRIIPYLIVSNVSFAYIHAGYAEIFEITMD